MWKSWEGGRVKTLVTDLQLSVLSADVRRQRTTIIVEYFNRYFNRHNLYAYQFFICELLNFINVLGQIFLTDRLAPALTDYYCLFDITSISTFITQPIQVFLDISGVSHWYVDTQRTRQNDVDVREKCFAK